VDYSVGAVDPVRRVLYFASFSGTTASIRGLNLTTGSVVYSTSMGTVLIHGIEVDDGVLILSSDVNNIRLHRYPANLATGSILWSSPLATYTPLFGGLTTVNVEGDQFYAVLRDVSTDSDVLVEIDSVSGVLSFTTPIE
jgi:outer membrane protein assembly factor BamB